MGLKKNNPGCNCCDTGCPPITCDDESEEIVDSLTITIDLSGVEFWAETISSGFGSPTIYQKVDANISTLIDRVYTPSRQGNCDWPVLSSAIFSNDDITGTVTEYGGLDQSGCPSGPTVYNIFTLGNSAELTAGTAVTDQVDALGRYIQVEFLLELQIQYGDAFGYSGTFNFTGSITANVRCATVDLILDYDSGVPCDPTGVDPIVGSVVPTIT